MLEMIEKVIRDGGNLHIEPALYGGDIFVCIDFPCYFRSEERRVGKEV